MLLADVVAQLALSLVIVQYASADWSVVGGNGPTLQFSSLPAAISSISQLQELYLSYHTVGGSLPPELGLLTNLRVLTLSGNGAMSGTLPSQWSTLVNLQVLQLGAMSGVSGKSSLMLSAPINDHLAAKAWSITQLVVWVSTAAS